MNNFKSLVLFTLTLLPQTILAGSFDDDEQRFNVEGQSITESLGNVNTILCYMAAMRTDQLVNDGVYRAKIYDDDCDSSDADAASEQSSATAASASASAAATTTQGQGVAAKASSKSILSIVRESNSSPVLGVVWVEQASDSPDEPDALVYVDVEQSAGPSELSPNGDFVMNYSVHVDTSKDLDGKFAFFGIEDGLLIQQGYILASGQEIKFRELGQQYEANVSATFLENGDKYGVYGEDAGYNSFDTQVDLQAYYQFYMSAADKGYCRKLTTVEEIIWPDPSTAPEEPGEDFDWAAFWDPSRTDVYNAETGVNDLANHSQAGLSATEECYTTDRAKAQRNVHSYGVYNTDGSRLAIENPSFPLRVTLPNGNASGGPLDVYAYADYWGVWVDPIGRALIDENTIFTKESFNEEVASDESNYNLTSTEVKIVKRQTSFEPLDNLNGLTLMMNVDDPAWSEEFAILFGRVPAYTEYEASFDKDTETFVLAKALVFDPSYEEVTLDEPITFTSTQWLATMKRTFGTISDDWFFEDIRRLNVWSPDTQQNYEILRSAFENSTLAAAPANGEQGIGVRTERSSFVTEADLTEKLYCLRDCLTADKVLQMFTESVQEGASIVASPFADVGEYLKADIGEFVAGDYFDGILEAEMVVYETIAGVLVDPTGAEFSKGDTASGVLASLERPEQNLQLISYIDSVGDTRSIGWGIRTGQLFAASDLTKMECRKTGEDQTYDGHPVYGTSTDVKRYCGYQIYEGGLATTYDISVEISPAYQIRSATTGEIVTIDAPKTLYYNVPNDDAAFGEDVGKRIRVEFRGHGQLEGIPGFVYDPLTGTDLGEYVDVWQDHYRYLRRFIMPDGSALEDATDRDTTYKVKALYGEEWLTKADGTVSGVLDLRGKYTYIGNKASLVATNVMRVPGDPFNIADYIGAVPTDNIINDGKASVIHGEVIFDPTP